MRFYEEDKILTDREVKGMKSILSVTRDSEVKKLLNKKLQEHIFQSYCKQVARDTHKWVIKVNKQEEE